MPPKVKFSKDTIIDAAFEIARTEGIDRVTIRRVAELMGSSIAPIYVNFADIDALKKAVIQKVQAIFQQMITTPHSGNPFRDIGIASIKFAREYKVLFRDLILTHNTYLQEAQPPIESMIKIMRQDAQLDPFTDEELADIFFKMRVFQLGLSVMDVNGLLLEEFDEERLIAMLQSTGWDVIAAAHMRKRTANDANREKD